ncbi:MAG TPA: hypothetical protein VIV12_08380, partial [Streptosporangiaceae bacterium]
TGGTIGGKAESRPLQFGPLYHDDPMLWDDLRRCLTELKLEHPLWADHLSWRYWGGHSARKCVRHLRRNRDLVPIGLHTNQERLAVGGACGTTLTLDCVVYTWPPWVLPRAVDDALAFVDSRMQIEPFLPKAVLKWPQAS